MSVKDRFADCDPEGMVEAALFAALDELQAQQSINFYSWDSDVLEKFLEGARERVRHALVKYISGNPRAGA